MNYKKMHDLKKRIEEVLSGSGKMNDYSGQVMAEAIVQVLLEEGLFTSQGSVTRIKKEKK
ncbi:MAG: hypothetical protein ACXVNM_03685 [Bacteroidia bacterium]